MIRPKREEHHFIHEVLTSQNPKDIYYINIEEKTKQYALLMLFGMLLVFYMMIN